MSYIIVVGSKPNSIIPKVKAKKIYCANGAAEIARRYKKKYKNVKIISLVGLREFQKNFRVRSRIIKSQPDKIIVRMGKLNKNELKLKKVKIKNNSVIEQFKFQSKFFHMGFFNLYLSELFWGKNLFLKIKHFVKRLAGYFNRVLLDFIIFRGKSKFKNYNIRYWNAGGHSIL